MVGLREGICTSSSMIGFSFKVVVLYFPLFFAHQSCIGMSQCLNCELLSGFAGAGPVILFLSTQYKIECTFVKIFSSRVSLGVYSVANFPEILSIKKLSFPCQFPRSTGLIVFGSISK